MLSTYTVVLLMSYARVFEGESWWRDHKLYSYRWLGGDTKMTLNYFHLSSTQLQTSVWFFEHGNVVAHNVRMCLI